MTEYRVGWVVDIDAGDAIEAAIAAFNMMQQPRDPNDPDAAVVFEVWQSFDADPMNTVTVDLAGLHGVFVREDLWRPDNWTYVDLKEGEVG